MSEPLGWVVHWTNANGVACRREFAAADMHEAVWCEAQLAAEAMRATRAGTPGPSGVYIAGHRPPAEATAPKQDKPKRRTWAQD